MGEGGWLNFGYAGAGEWSRKIDEYSSRKAYPLKSYDVKSKEDIELEADYHEQIEELLPSNKFYRDLDVLVIGNFVRNHEIQFYHALEHMSEGLIVYEKALSPRFESHKRYLDKEIDDEQVKTVPTLHYWKKPAALKAEEVIEDYDLDSIESIEVIAQEQRLERPWCLTPPDGGSVVDFGSHVPELPLINLNGSFADNPLEFALGWNTNAEIEDEGFSRYNEAFEARWGIEGELFNENTYLDALVGKNFEQEKKQFLIKGNTSEHGSWRIKGYYGTKQNKPKLEFTSDELDRQWKLSNMPDAKKAVVDDLMDYAKEGNLPRLNSSKHAEIMKGLDLANQEIGLYQDGELKIEEWEGVPKLDYELLNSEMNI